MKYFFQIPRSLNLFQKQKLDIFETKGFLNSIQNLNREDFRNKTFELLFKFWFQIKHKSKWNLDKNKCFLHAPQY
jgi:hypothetical protein